MRATLQSALLAGTILASFTGLPAAAAMAAPVDPAAPAATEAAPADAAADDEQGLGDIIVTAQKIEQRLTDVPITISAVSGQRIRDLGVTDLDELSNYIPGLNIQEQSANNPGIVIRGITSDSGSAQQGPRVTLYYNGVDISRSRGSYQGIYDLERVEVIKGPQATLFGTASAIGAISLTSARPREGTEGMLSIGYGNFDQKQLSGYFNAGNGKIGGRVAFEWRKRDGYVENLAPNQDDLYAQDNLGVRGSIRFTPSDVLTIDLIGTYDRQRNSGTPFISRALPTTDGPGNPFGRAFLGGSPLSGQVLGKDELGLDRNVYDLNLSATYELSDNWSLTTVNGYRQFDSLEVFDADGSAAWYLEFAEEARGWQFNHELRLSYTSDTFRGFAGWNYFHEDGSQRVPFSTEEGTYIQCATRTLVPGLPCIAANGTVSAAQATAIRTGGLFTRIPYSSVFENRGRNDQYSLFADATFIPTPALEITAGLRYLFERRRSGYLSVVPNSVLSGAPLIPGQINTGGQEFSAKDTFDAWLPRVNVLYRVSPNINLFATVSKGRRSPVLQVDAQRVAGVVQRRLQNVSEETVWNYEAGIKGSAGIFSGALGVYLQEYQDFQVSITENGVNITRSAGNASNLGVELELQAKPTEWLTLFGNVGYIDGGIDNDPANGRFAGNRFRLQPEWQGAAGFTIDAPIGEGMRFFLTPSVTYRSRIFFELPNNPAISQGAVTLINARGGVSFADKRYEIAAFIRNATNKDYLLDAGNTGGGFGIPTFIPAEPRFYGIQATARF
ncbi:TonB-dependent receptor [Sphingomonas changnyeongensis]|uniref:TonB-dependent receptor n=1 Tax=Sphingomonas changnyeongensis TaxID=2698679 RepID=A0A7Z2SA70_9SPHN|nr:TonB-dependent receptor [Sphingomonas changnyeongensis]QHL91544.1 TonB-dependent receptor [Sphingomonas changnyeongensis]